MQPLSILALAAAGLASAAPTPSSGAGSICHLLTYTGSCGNLTTISNSSASSSSSSSCSYSNVCLVPSTPNATLLGNSINALTGTAFLSGSGSNNGSRNSSGSIIPGQPEVYVNATGFVDLAFSGAPALDVPSQGVCDGERYIINGTEMAYQCICNDIPDSCPDAGGAAVSISFANGTSSTSAIPADAGPSEFSWTWAPSATSTGGAVKIVNGSQTTISDVSATPTARTTFVGTFGSLPVTSSAAGQSQSTSASGIGAGAAASGNGDDKSGDASSRYGIAVTCTLLVGASAALLTLM